jgi:hypothetical protein
MTDLRSITDLLVSNLDEDRAALNLHSTAGLVKQLPRPDRHLFLEPE